MAKFKKTPIPQDLRQAVFERDGWKCRYCGSTEQPFHADHVYPESRGGATIIENLVTACQACNLKKHATVGMWPNPVGYFDENEVALLKKREQFSKNIASGYRLKYNDIRNFYNYFWSFLAQYAFMPLVIAYFAASYVIYFPNSHTSTMIEIVAFMIGISVGMCYSAFVTWRHTR